MRLGCALSNAFGNDMRFDARLAAAQRGQLVEQVTARPVPQAPTTPTPYAQPQTPDPITRAGAPARPPAQQQQPRRQRRHHHRHHGRRNRAHSDTDDNSSSNDSDSSSEDEHARRRGRHTRRRQTTARQQPQPQAQPQAQQQQQPQGGAGSATDTDWSRRLQPQLQPQLQEWQKAPVIAAQTGGGIEPRAGARLVQQLGEASLASALPLGGWTVSDATLGGGQPGGASCVAQNPLGASFGRGSAMYGAGIPHNGMPQPGLDPRVDGLPSSIGDAAGTFTDPNTGATFYAYTDSMPDPLLLSEAPTVQLGQPSRMLEQLTGVNPLLAKPCAPRPREICNDWNDAIEGATIPESLVQMQARAAMSATAARDVYFTNPEVEAGYLDTHWDGYIGTTYVMRPVIDTQTLQDNDETNTVVAPFIAQPDLVGAWGPSGLASQWGGPMQPAVQVLAADQASGPSRPQTDATAFGVTAPTPTPQWVAFGNDGDTVRTRPEQPTYIAGSAAPALPSAVASGRAGDSTVNGMHAVQRDGSAAAPWATMTTGSDRARASAFDDTIAAGRRAGMDDVAGGGIGSAVQPPLVTGGDSARLRDSTTTSNLPLGGTLADIMAGGAHSSSLVAGSDAGRARDSAATARAGLAQWPTAQQGGWPALVTAAGPDAAAVRDATVSWRGASTPSEPGNFQGAPLVAAAPDSATGGRDAAFSWRAAGAPNEPGGAQAAFGSSAAPDSATGGRDAAFSWRAAGAPNEPGGAQAAFGGPAAPDSATGGRDAAFSWRAAGAPNEPGGAQAAFGGPAAPDSATGGRDAAAAWRAPAAPSQPGGAQAAFGGLAAPDSATGGRDAAAAWRAPAAPSQPGGAQSSGWTPSAGDGAAAARDAALAWRSTTTPGNAPLMADLYPALPAATAERARGADDATFSSRAAAAGNGPAWSSTPADAGGVVAAVADAARVRDASTTSAAAQLWTMPPAVQGNGQAAFGAVGTTDGVRAAADAQAGALPAAAWWAPTAGGGSAGTPAAASRDGPRAAVDSAAGTLRSGVGLPEGVSRTTASAAATASDALRGAHDSAVAAGQGASALFQGVPWAAQSAGSAVPDTGTRAAHDDATRASTVQREVPGDYYPAVQTGTDTGALGARDASVRSAPVPFDVNNAAAASWATAPVAGSDRQAFVRAGSEMTPRVSNNRTLSWTGGPLTSDRPTVTFNDGDRAQDSCGVPEAHMSHQRTMREAFAAAHPSSFGAAAEYRQVYAPQQQRAGVVLPNLASVRQWCVNPQAALQERAMATQLAAWAAAAAAPHPVMRCTDVAYESDA